MKPCTPQCLSCILTKRRNLISDHMGRIFRQLKIEETVKNRGEMFFRHLDLFVILDEESTVNITHRTVEGFAIKCKSFCDAVYCSEIIAVYGIFCFPDYAITNFFLISRTLRWTIRDFVRYRTSSASGMYLTSCVAPRQMTQGICCPISKIALPPSTDR